MSGNFLLWLFYHVLSTKIDIYMPSDIRQHNVGTVRQAMHYAYGIFRGEQAPHHPSINRKFNALQQIAYLNIMTLLIPTTIFTGFMLWDAKFFSKWIVFLGGIRVIDSVHVLLFLFFSSFLFVHIYLATLGSTPLAHIKAMITGYEEAEGEHAHDFD
jgi:thiosulfate reductase cytochrome b subunit